MPHRDKAQRFPHGEARRWQVLILGHGPALVRRLTLSKLKQAVSLRTEH